jgi:endo-1,3(4)-beta-glucanase
MLPYLATSITGVAPSLLRLVLLSLRKFAMIQCQRMSLIIRNSEHVGRSDLIPPVINYLKASFEYWFKSSSGTVPAYETAWGGIINKAGYNNGNVDFGNGYYNDHHFHYGYFLTVAAVIGKYDGSWLNQHRTFINWFARDIINPSTQDPYFTVTRTRDWFAGHSWASGIANGAGSRDEESTGEGVNAYYGALLWASVALSQDMVNYAKLLVATEQQASQVYWHLYPQQSSTARDNPYPEQSIRNLVTIGNVQDWQAGAWLFWGAQKVQIAAIQILPVTPINEVSLPSDFGQGLG